MNREQEYVELLKKARSIARDICEDVEGNDRLSWQLSRQVLTDDIEAHAEGAVR